MSEKELESIVVSTDEVDNSTFDYQLYLYGYIPSQDFYNEESREAFTKELIKRRGQNPHVIQFPNDDVIKSIIDDRDE